MGPSKKKLGKTKHQKTLTLTTQKIKKKGKKKHQLKRMGFKKQKKMIEKRKAVELDKVLKVVPWASSAEWEHVCLLFNNEDFETAISEILIWTKRVPAIPVGVESTLYLLQALDYDKQIASSNQEILVESGSSDWKEQIARSLYSLAIIRFINHVSLMAAKEREDLSTTMSMAKLAMCIDVPEWLVHLRHDVSHGSTIPSLEMLRLAASFIKSWLRSNYWISTESESPSSQVLVQHQKRSELEQVELATLIVSLISAYVATGVYKLRHRKTIFDSEILQFTTLEATDAFGVETNAVFKELKASLENFLNSDPDITCSILAEEMIPPIDFYQDLGMIFKKVESFQSLFIIWNPILKILFLNGQLLQVLSRFAQIHSEECPEPVAEISAFWIDKLLEKIQFGGEEISAEELRDLSQVLLRSPKPCSEIFLPRLFQITEASVGSEIVRKLASLTHILMNGETEIPALPTAKPLSYKFVTVEDLTSLDKGGGETLSQPKEYRLWELDKRDGEKFWSTVPHGTIFS